MAFQPSILKNPNGTYSWVGTVDVRLTWVNKDGSPLTFEQARAVAQASNPGMLAKARVFATPEAARAAAEALAQ